MSTRTSNETSTILTMYFMILRLKIKKLYLSKCYNLQLFINIIINNDINEDYYYKY